MSGMTRKEALAPRADISVGTKVAGNIAPLWGTGTVVEINANPKLKPYIVRRDSDGALGYFFGPQLDVVTA